MKKIIGLLLGLTSMAALASCDLSALMGSGTSESLVQSTGSQEVVESVESGESGEHKHSLTRVSERAATCAQEGNITHWTCDCGAYFTDAMGKDEVTAEDVVIAKKEHTLKHTTGIEATCISSGRLENWSCTVCSKAYADEGCTEEIKMTQILLPKTSHALTHHEEIPVVGKENGVMEHWTCEYCSGYFTDAEGSKKVNESALTLYSPLGITDFVVEVPVGRYPVILQLSDTQIIDAGQTRPGRDGVEKNLWATDKMDERCFDYLTEVITATNPDFIIITGDVIYGEFDDNGTVLTAFINFMDSFQIPWSPVFGNHDNESKKGVDWQCDQFENSPYCLFEQKELSGNGNYSVAIAQGGEVKRAFYMLDTNACGNASEESKANGHTLPNFAGFKPDQIAWYTEEIELLKQYAPDVKISFAYHIQQAVFGEAYAKYGFNQSNKYQDINLDTMDDVAESDFGYIGRQMKGPWDTDKKVYNGMKALGVDSIFVGHEHCNNVSVVYEGIRFTYGLKSSEYDRYNALLSDGTVKGAYGYEMPKDNTPLIGGTVIVLSDTNGAITDCYNYYCGFEDGKIDWSVYEPDVPESVMEIPDFVVEVPVGRNPVVLQLSDTQIIDAAQTREGRDGVSYDLWATDQIEERCYDYLTEVITATNPDFIIITGDVVYGEFDDAGTSLTSFIKFMDSFEIPWSPVFGNHDNESKKGVDWQCEQFEASKYCCFEQKELSGNGNYSVGIAQGGELLRVFYMMDTNACGAASAESLANGHTYNNYVGFKQDQIDWYTNQIKMLKEFDSDVKISFAYHIQQSVFGEAYAKYGFNQDEKMQNINLDTLEGVADTDFGYIGRQMKGPWDTSKTVYNAMKKLGVDSIFVGHEHCNNVSVVYDGIRFTYGLKSSEYDRYNWLNGDGTVDGGYGNPTGTKSLVGGTVIVLSDEDGVIEDCYNYYCGFENGKIDWNKYKKMEVGGLQYNGVHSTIYNGLDNIAPYEMWADGAVTAEAVEFDETTNAWKVTAGSQGKLFINTALMRGKTTFTFTLYMENAVGQYELNPFAIRVKPDDGSGAGIAGMFESGSSKKQYIRYQVGDAASADEVRLELGVWKTYTVDITSIAETCTEFAFNIATGNTLYLKDIALS